MAILINNDNANKALIKRVEKLSGVDLSSCYQCKKCSSGCPMADMMDSSPAEIFRKLHLQAGPELLESELIWGCLSCETCTNRCPMGIDGAAVMDALRQIAREQDAVKSKGKGNAPLFNKAFLKTVEMFGRSYELAMITAYKLGTGKLMDDTEKLPTMLAKGKIGLLPPRGADKKTVKRIFEKTKKKGEE